MNEGATGSKYDSSLSTKAIARRFRQDVQHARKGEALPQGLRVSVRIRHNSMSSAIDVTITALGFGLQILNPDWKPERGLECDRLTLDARRIRDLLETMLQAYNYNRSESQTDYFDVNFYGHVAYDWRLERAEPVPA